MTIQAFVFLKCNCGNCHLDLLQNAKECQCCQEIDGCKESLNSDLVLCGVDSTPNCLILHSGFDPVCLNRWSLCYTGLKMGQSTDQPQVVFTLLEASLVDWTGAGFVGKVLVVGPHLLFPAGRWPSIFLDSFLFFLNYLEILKGICSQGNLSGSVLCLQANILCFQANTGKMSCLPALLAFTFSQM